MKSWVAAVIILIGLIIIAAIDHVAVDGPHELFPVAVTHGDRVMNFELKELR